MSIQTSVSYPRDRPPASNYAIMLVTTCAFAVQMLLDPGAQYLSGLVLTSWSMPGLFGHMWLHMTVVHLVGNLVTLWIFGYRVCPRIGDLTYAIAYVAAGIGAACVHVVYDGRPVIGASGAIMGVLGLYVVLFFHRLGRLGPWLILTWFLATTGAAIVGEFPAAYAAHIGGFLSGMLVAVCLMIYQTLLARRADAALTVPVESPTKPHG